jgi:hypothetical protein
MQTTEIILRDNGTLTERVIRERNLNAEESVLESLTEGMTRNLRNVFTLPDWGSVHANVGSTDTVWTVVINRIPLHARFRLSTTCSCRRSRRTPTWNYPLVWHAPKEVRSGVRVRTEAEGDCVRVCGNWLFACDGDNRGYRLPLPNLHDDCLICTGSFAEHHPTGHDCVTASLEQFRKSKWNADLMRTIEKSQQFFRFQPTNDTFETLPIAATDWTSLCDKVSTHIMERVIL